MAMHMEAFRSSIATGANTFGQVTYISAGALLAPLVNGVQVSVALSKVHSIFGVGAHLDHIRPQAASFLPLPYPTLGPNNRSAAVESPPRFHDFSVQPIPLRPTEEFDIFATQDSGAGENEAVFVQFTDGNNEQPPSLVNIPGINGNGRYFTAHGTGSTTLTANAWTQCTVSLDQALPAGYYAMIGARAFSAGALAFRIQPQIEPLWRPGGVAVQAYDQMDPPGQRAFPITDRHYGGWGVWVKFFQNVVPYVQMWSTSADTAEEFWFDLVKLSDVVTAGAL